ncbi:MAG: hypothetical protein EAZ78_09860 [Oscillatoriales cyanobacterium]|nr:MAG: hypothetical protein EAZ98_12030 [Oscillatoriales cyanobacterium]TAE06287.1 MAG: hypothetical protein EAZ96_02820 [Oscillatoriales cyanobacterium]TAF04208.1 MAG: hypothetical protein EAZ78_09860 [Oscillatoriales cyanobacterium]TAF37148.1 MAG: hypothetical protein EAZ68_15240 [Oscillatoriales cyanobacterium]TAF63900.1 MAG: hypothetical protein EAZ59_19765 [Oscillatoriales cyanobacterium]
MDSQLTELREKLESPNLSFIAGGYLRYSVRQTTVQVAVSEPRRVDIFEEFVLHSALTLNPPPIEAEIAEMLGIDPMFVRDTTKTLQTYNNLVIGSESGIIVKPLTQELFIEKKCILKPKSTQNIYAIEDFLTGDFDFTTTPVKNAPVSLNIIDDLINDQNQLTNESRLSLEAIKGFICKNNDVFVTGYNEIESKKVYKIIGVLAFQNIKGDYLIKAFLGNSELQEISNKLTKLTEQQQLTLENLGDLLSPTIPSEVITSVRDSSISRLLIGRNTRRFIEPERVYIGLPLRLAHVVLWVDRKYRTNPLSHIPGGSDVVVEYHDGSALGYDWIKDPWAYIRTFFAGLVEYGSDESHSGSPGTGRTSDPKKGDFNKLDEKIQLEITKNKIARFYARKYNNGEEYSTAAFVEVWNSETSKEMPWNALKRFATKPQKQYYFDFDQVSEFNPTSILDYYGYEPEYEDPIDKAERLFGIPDPRLVED